MSVARIASAADSSVSLGAYLGAFYGRYFFWVNVVTRWLGADIKGFGVANVLPILVWSATTFTVLKQYRYLCAACP